MTLYFCCIFLQDSVLTTPILKPFYHAKQSHSRIWYHRSLSESPNPTRETRKWDQIFLHHSDPNKSTPQIYLNLREHHHSWRGSLVGKLYTHARSTQNDSLEPLIRLNFSGLPNATILEHPKMTSSMCYFDPCYWIGWYCADTRFGGSFRSM